MKKSIYISFLGLSTILLLALILEIYDTYNPSDSGDMGSLSFYLETKRADGGNVNAALHLAKYHEYNGNFKQEYKVLLNLIESKTIKTQSEWERIIGSSLENCHYTGFMSPKEIMNGFDNAKNYGGLNERAEELRRRWERGEFSKCTVQ